MTLQVLLKTKHPITTLQLQSSLRPNKWITSLQVWFNKETIKKLSHQNRLSKSATVPVLSSFVLKYLIAVLNLLTGHSIHSHCWIFLCYFQENIEDWSFAVLPHVPVWTPENICGVCCPVEVVQLVLHQQRDAGMRHNAQAGMAPDVSLITHRGCVVHPDHTLVPVYFFSKACAEHLPRARNQSTLIAVHVQELLRRHRSRRLLQVLSDQRSCDFSHHLLWALYEWWKILE